MTGAGQSRGRALLYGFLGVAVGGLATVLGVHSALERRYRLPVLGAGIAWLVFSGLLLLVVLTAWGSLGRRGRAVAEVVGGLLVLPPLAGVWVVVLLCTDGVLTFGGVSTRDAARERRPRGVRVVAHLAGALVLGILGGIYGLVLSGGAAGLVIGVVAASGLGLVLLTVVDAVAMRRAGRAS